MEPTELLDSLWQSFNRDIMVPSGLCFEEKEAIESMIKEIFFGGLCAYAQLAHDGGKTTKKILEILTPDAIMHYVKDPK